MEAGIGLYVKNSAAAVELYCKAFGLELGYNVKNPDGSFYHSSLCRNGKEIISVDESEEDKLVDNMVQVGIIMDTVEDVQRAFDLLSVGGKVQLDVGPLPWSDCAASFTDAFGIWWYVSVAQHHPDDSFDPAKPLR